MGGQRFEEWPTLCACRAGLQLQFAACLGHRVFTQWPVLVSNKLVLWEELLCLLQEVRQQTGRVLGEWPALREDVGHCSCAGRGRNDAEDGLTAPKAPARWSAGFIVLLGKVQPEGESWHVQAAWLKWK